GDGARARGRKAARRGADRARRLPCSGEGRRQLFLPRVVHPFSPGPRREGAAAGAVALRPGDPVRAAQEYKNPLPTTDAIIAGPDRRIVLILRKNEPRGWALPGGFVDAGEELGAACRREAKAETRLDVGLVTPRFTYTDPLP